ncbi:hypothetical protein DFR26_2084 [Paraperlucidibaca baekdonensis]|uniref:Uncharacterized protein n=1 Tax=Paraperlucidibaca baekdonensis TaxID=748120 RepID=A0A3E0H1L5_9GAMM|nr:hypothetical protein DFR26_2084 [Paraperlucidibaca baekdonensis]
MSILGLNKNDYCNRNPGAISATVLTEYLQNGLPEDFGTNRW